MDRRNNKFLTLIIASLIAFSASISQVYASTAEDSSTNGNNSKDIVTAMDSVIAESNGTQVNVGDLLDKISDLLHFVAASLGSGSNNATIIAGNATISTATPTTTTTTTENATDTGQPIVTILPPTPPTIEEGESAARTTDQEDLSSPPTTDTG